MKDRKSDLLFSFRRGTSDSYSVQQASSSGRNRRRKKQEEEEEEEEVQLKRASWSSFPLLRFTSTSSPRLGEERHVMVRRKSQSTEDLQLQVQRKQLKQDYEQKPKPRDDRKHHWQLKHQKHPPHKSKQHRSDPAVATPKIGCGFFSVLSHSSSSSSSCSSYTFKSTESDVRDSFMSVLEGWEGDERNRLDMMGEIRRKGSSLNRHHNTSCFNRPTTSVSGALSDDLIPSRYHHSASRHHHSLEDKLEGWIGIKPGPNDPLRPGTLISRTTSEYISASRTVHTSEDEIEGSSSAPLLLEEERDAFTSPQIIYAHRKTPDAKRRSRKEIVRELETIRKTGSLPPNMWRQKEQDPSEEEEKENQKPKAAQGTKRNLRFMTGYRFFGKAGKGRSTFGSSREGEREMGARKKDEREMGTREEGESANNARKAGEREMGVWKEGQEEVGAKQEGEKSWEMRRKKLGGKKDGVKAKWEGSEEDWCLEDGTMEDKSLERDGRRGRRVGERLQEKGRWEVEEGEMETKEIGENSEVDPRMRETNAEGKGERWKVKATEEERIEGTKARQVEEIMTKLYDGIIKSKEGGNVIEGVRESQEESWPERRQMGYMEEYMEKRETERETELERVKKEPGIREVREADREIERVSEGLVYDPSCPSDSKLTVSHYLTGLPTSQFSLQLPHSSTHRSSQQQHSSSRHQNSISQHQPGPSQHWNSILQHQYNPRQSQNTVPYQYTQEQQQNSPFQHQHSLPHYQNSGSHHQHSLPQHQHSSSQHQHSLPQHQSLFQHQYSQVQQQCNPSQHQTSLSLCQNSLSQGYYNNLQLAQQRGSEFGQSNKQPEFTSPEQRPISSSQQLSGKDCVSQSQHNRRSDQNRTQGLFNSTQQSQHVSGISHCCFNPSQTPHPQQSQNPTQQQHNNVKYSEHRHSPPQYANRPQQLNHSAQWSSTHIQNSSNSPQVHQPFTLNAFLSNHVLGIAANDHRFTANNLSNFITSDLTLVGNPVDTASDPSVNSEDSRVNGTIHAVNNGHSVNSFSSLVNDECPAVNQRTSEVNNLYANTREVNNIYVNTHYANCAVINETSRSNDSGLGPGYQNQSTNFPTNSSILNTLNTSHHSQNSTTNKPSAAHLTNVSSFALSLTNESHFALESTNDLPSALDTTNDSPLLGSANESIFKPNSFGLALNGPKSSFAVTYNQNFGIIEEEEEEDEEDYAMQAVDSTCFERDMEYQLEDLAGRDEEEEEQDEEETQKRRGRGEGEKEKGMARTTSEESMNEGGYPANNEGVRKKTELKLNLVSPQHRALQQVQRGRLLRHISEEVIGKKGGGEEEEEEVVELRSTPSTPRSPVIDFDDVFRQQQKALVEDSDDMSRVRDLATRLQLATRRPSYVDWAAQIRERGRKVGEALATHAPTVLEQEVEPTEQPEQTEQLEESAQTGKEQLEEERRKRNLQTAVDWVKKELQDMRTQDQQLARQLMQLRVEVQRLRLVKSCYNHQALVEEVVNEAEEAKLFLPDLCDLPSDLREPFSPVLHDIGVTKMNLTSRRFSLR